MAQRGTREVTRASPAILRAYRGGPKLAVNERSQVDFAQPPTRIEDACARFDGRTSAAEAPQQKDREGRLTSGKCATWSLLESSKHLQDLGLGMLSNFDHCLSGAKSKPLPKP